MKRMKTEDAVGQMLCHDITQIIKDVKKDVVFRKGHIIREEDVDVMKSVGKFHVYIWEYNEHMMHENDAAMVMYEFCKNEFMSPTTIKEGKLELLADRDGVFKIDRERLLAINSLGDMMIASIHGDTPVKKGDKLAGMRVIPLIIGKEKMEAAKNAVAGGQIFQLLPYIHKKVGIVTTGKEVYDHLIEDTFTPVVIKKLEEFDMEIVGHKYSSDDMQMEVRCIKELLDAGADMIICTGGMSVDPDDMTPYAIRACSDRVVSYGAPVLPGAMFMLGYKGELNIPILGLPGCVMYERRTIFDIVLPRIMAGDVLEPADIWRLGEGGLCTQCKICTFPNCGFGKG